MNVRRLQSKLADFANRVMGGRYTGWLESLKAFTGRPPKNVIQLKLCVVGEAGVGIEGVSAAKRWIIEVGGASLSFFGGQGLGGKESSGVT